MRAKKFAGKSRQDQTRIRPQAQSQTVDPNMQESPSQLEGGQTSEDATGQRTLREQLRKARQHRL